MSKCPTNSRPMSIVRVSPHNIFAPPLDAMIRKWVGGFHMDAMTFAAPTAHAGSVQVMRQAALVVYFSLGMWKHKALHCLVTRATHTGSAILLTPAWGSSLPWPLPSPPGEAGFFVYGCFSLLPWGFSLPPPSFSGAGQHQIGVPSPQRSGQTPLLH